MAKSRQQRKAERRRREEAGPPAAQPQQQERLAGRDETIAEEAGAPIEADAALGVDAEQLVELPEPTARKEEKAREKEERQSKPAKSKQPRRAEKRPSGPRERSRVLTFLSEVRAELKRVQWPDRQTLMQATGVVIVTVLIAAAYLGVLDYIFNKLIHRVL